MCSFPPLCPFGFPASPKNSCRVAVKNLSELEQVPEAGSLCRSFSLCVMGTELPAAAFTGLQGGLIRYQQETLGTQHKQEHGNVGSSYIILQDLPQCHSLSSPALGLLCSFAVGVSPLDLLSGKPPSKQVWALPRWWPDPVEGSGRPGFLSNPCLNGTGAEAAFRVSGREGKTP